MPQAVIEVCELAPAASFYAAVTQPFGIRFLSSSSDARALYFGFPAFPPSPPETILTLVQVPNPTPTTITFTAQSRETVKEFYDRAVRAAEYDTDHTIDHQPTLSIAQIYDFDGNMVEARHSARRSSAPQPETVAPSKTSSRIEAWREDVDKSMTNPTVVPDASDFSPRRPTRTATYPAGLAYREKETTSSGGLIPGISNHALLGTLLGAAAGAAAAYAMVRSEEPEKEEVHVIPIREAKTYADSIPASRMYRDERERYYAAPEQRVVEVERSVAGVSHGRPTKSVHYSVVQMADNDRKTIVYRDEKSVADSQAECKSRAGTDVSVRSSKSKANQQMTIVAAPSKVSTSSKRDPTVVSARNVPLPESVAPSRVSAQSKREPTVVSARNVPLPESVAPSKVSRAEHVPLPESVAASSYVSARTSKSKSTVRGRDATSTTSRSHHSHHSHHKSSSHSSRRDKESRVSAREVPLPESVLDDSVSVAPSDSVSCAGSKRERIERALGMGRSSLIERGSPREARSQRGAMSDTDRLRRRF